MLTPYAASKFWRQYLTGSEGMNPPSQRWVALHRFPRMDVRQDTASWSVSEQPYPWLGQGATPGGYARQNMNATAPVGGKFSNGGQLAFGPATINRWAPSICFGLYDAATVGNMLAWGVLHPKRLGLDQASHDLSLPVGDRITIPLNTLEVDCGYRGREREVPLKIPGCIGWWWAGRGGTNLRVTRVGGGRYLLNACFDLSGNNNHISGPVGGEAGCYPGLTLPDNSKRGFFETLQWVIGVEKWKDGGGHGSNRYVFASPLNLTGPFTLVAHIANTRLEGVRDMWGHNDANNRIELEQLASEVRMLIGGVSKTVSATVPRGVVTLSIERDAANIVRVRANGIDISANGGAGVHHPGTFPCQGFGYKGGGTSQWDDYLFELIAYNRTFTTEEIRELERQNYLHFKYAVQAVERPRWEGLSDWGAQQLALWLTGTSLTKPTSWRAALLHRDPKPSETGATMDEADYAGYARQTITPSSDPLADGRGSNVNTITFPQPNTGSEPKGPFGSLAIVDTITAGAGNVLAFVPLETPRTYRQADGPIIIRAESLSLNIGRIVGIH